METQPETAEQQDTKTEAASAAADPAPEAQDVPQDEAAAPVEQMIQVAPGVAVTLSQFRAAADPLCRYCSGGIITERSGKKVIRRPCGCAARHILREMRAQMPSKATVTVTRDPVKARQRVEEQLAALRTEAAALENDVGARTKGAKDAADEAEAAVRVAEKLKARSVERVAEAVHGAQAIEAEYKARLAEAEREVGEENDLLAARINGLAQARTAHEQALAKLARAGRDTEGARKRAANLRRRADAIEARNREVLAESPAQNAPNEQKGGPDATG